MFFDVFSKTRIFLVICTFVFLPGPVFAASQPQTISGVNKTSPLRVYFDVNVGVAKMLETRLMLINTTYDQLLQRNSNPEFIVGFRGKASYFVTKGDGYVETEDVELKKKIHQWVKTFKDKGIRLEQCRIAAGMTGIEVKDFLPEVEVVDNGYVSMIIYQNQGFSQIPMD